MKLLDRTFATPEENLACDEALLDAAEENLSGEVLRFWEPGQHFVVLGYSNKVSTEVDAAACEELGIPVLRRPSGGGTVLQGPGCLNFSLVLKIGNGPLKTLTSTNHFIMEKNKKALAELLCHSERSEESVLPKKQILPRFAPQDDNNLKIQGTTDLTLNGLKFSGNAQRRKKDFLLFHGTFLLNFDIRLIEKTLRLPSRQPDYRKARTHLDFLMNLDLPAEKVKEALTQTWKAERYPVPFDRIAELVAQKYSRREWNYKFE